TTFIRRTIECGGGASQCPSDRMAHKCSAHVHRLTARPVLSNRKKRCFSAHRGTLSPAAQNRKFNPAAKEIGRMRHWCLTAILIAVLPLSVLHAQSKDETSSVKVEASKTDTSKPEQFKPEQQQTKGSVTIGGKSIDYDAYAGTIIVHPKDWDDVPQNADPDPKNKTAEASMFYVAYFKTDAKGAPRPVTFFFNGGPGSSTVWLHMGAFGPKRVVTADDTHTPAAPY